MPPVTPGKLDHSPNISRPSRSCVSLPVIASLTNILQHARHMFIQSLLSRSSSIYNSRWTFCACKLGHSGEVSASVSDYPAHLLGESLRNFPPERKACRKMLLRLVRKLGRVSTCALLSVESRLLAGWITGEVFMKPRDRRLIWTTHALVFEPEKFRSLFDVITCGRFVD